MRKAKFPDSGIFWNSRLFCRIAESNRHTQRVRPCYSDIKHPFIRLWTLEAFLPIQNQLKSVFWLSWRVKWNCSFLVWSVFFFFTFKITTYNYKQRHSLFLLCLFLFRFLKNLWSRLFRIFHLLETNRSKTVFWSLSIATKKRCWYDQGVCFCLVIQCIKALIIG
jgi:hypothetical protein